MPRPVTLFTGQWADLPLEQMARKTKQFGYDGIELACWGDHFEVDKALADDGYCRRKRDLLNSMDLQCHAISAHLVGQAVCDNLGERHKEIAFDIYTAERALEAIGRRPEFGFNFDPSHLHWQGIDSVEFIRAFPDRIYHMHVKDAIVTLNGRTGILASHINFGDYRRGWDFRSPGRGTVNFEEIIRELNRIGYQGPLSVEWEDSGMDREFGAREACTFVKQKDFAASARAFDAAFEK